MAVTINEGTQVDVYTVVNAGTEIQVVKLDIGAGTAISDFGGTINRVTEQLRGTTTLVTTVSNLTNGTVRVSVGTIVGGTLQSGTVESLNIGRRHADEFATVVTSGTSTLGTIRAAVTGSQIFVTSLIVSVGSASNVEIASGGTSTLIVGSMFFNANGGVAAMPFDPPIRTASGSALVYKQSTNGPLTITATGYID